METISVLFVLSNASREYRELLPSGFVLNHDLYIFRNNILRGSSEMVCDGYPSKWSGLPASCEGLNSARMIFHANAKPSMFSRTDLQYYTRLEWIN